MGKVMRDYRAIEIKRNRIETMLLILKENCEDSFILKFYSEEELRKAKEGAKTMLEEVFLYLKWWNTRIYLLM